LKAAFTKQKDFLRETSTLGMSCWDFSGSAWQENLVEKTRAISFALSNIYCMLTVLQEKGLKH
jgi:hypothetical protein